MEKLKGVVKVCASVFLIGMSLILGVRFGELMWHKNETLRIVHYFCTEKDNGDEVCRKIRSGKYLELTE